MMTQGTSFIPPTMRMRGEFAKGVSGTKPSVIPRLPTEVTMAEPNANGRTPRAGKLTPIADNYHATKSVRGAEDEGKGYGVDEGEGYGVDEGKGYR